MDSKLAQSEIQEETTLQVTIDITDSKGYSSSSTISVTLLPAANATNESEEDPEVPVDGVDFVPEWKMHDY